MRKMLIIPLGLFLLTQVSAQDQNCDKTTIMSIKGKWVTSPDNIVSPDKTFPISQYNQLRTRLDKIAVMFQEAYSPPAGKQAEWYRSIGGSAIVNNGPVPYQFNSLYKSWYCNQNLHKLMLGSVTGDWAYVWVNSFGWLMTDQSDELWVKIEGTTAYLLANKIGEWKGFPMYEPLSHDKGKCKAILITRNNQLPYKPVSRLQFLKAMKEKWEADKKKEVDFKQRRQENIDLIAKYFDDRIKPFDEAWKGLSEDELKEPAIVNSDYHGLFKGFTTEEKGGRMIVLVNNDYFNLKLPRYVPQFMVLYWQWGAGTLLNFGKQIDDNFPVDKLKAMIDK